MKWDNLTMSQKQALMKIYVNNGITNLDEIRNHYNRYAEGGPTNNTTENNTVMYSRTPRESLGNIVNTRPVPDLITMTEVPRIGAGVNIPITEAINNMIARRSRVNTPTNVVSTDSIDTRRPVSYIGMPTRVNRFDGGGFANMPQYVTVPREQPVIQTAPTRMERFKNRATMVKDAMMSFVPSVEEKATDIATDKLLGKASNKIGLLGKVNNLPDTISKIENLKKAFNLPYNQGLIDSGSGQTLIGPITNRFEDGGDTNNDEYPLLKSKFLRSTEENPITVNFDLELFKYPEDVNDSNFKKINVDDLSRSYIMSDLRVLKNDDEYYTIAYDSEGNPVKIYDLKDNNIVPKGYHKHDNKALENSYIEARKKLDYIGDSDAEKARFLNKTESIVNAVDSLSNVYGINKDIFLERLIHEGFIDNLIHDYNYNYNLEQQNNIKNYSLYTPVKAFHHLGLDTAGEHLENGDYNLRWKDTNLGFWSEHNTNEKGTKTHSVGVPNLASGLEIKAAHIEYLTNLMKQRYPKASKQELNALINAAYNIGENHEDLNNKEWVNKNYEIVPWSELINKNK